MKKSNIFKLLLLMLLFVPVTILAGSSNDDATELPIPDFKQEYTNNYSEIYTCDYRINLSSESVFFGTFDFSINFSKAGNGARIIVNQVSDFSDLTDLDVSQVKAVNAIKSISYNNGYSCPRLMAFLKEEEDTQTGKLIEIFEVKDYDSTEYNKYKSGGGVTNKYYVLNNYKKSSYNCNYNKDDCNSQQYCKYALVDSGHKEYKCVEVKYGEKQTPPENTTRTEVCSGYVESIFKQTLEYSFSASGALQVSLGSGNFSFSGSTNFVDKQGQLYDLWKNGKCCSNNKLGINYNTDSTELSCDNSSSAWNYDNPNDYNEDKDKYNPGEDVSGCEVVPEEVRKWIKISLNFIKYIALILVIVLGTIDFIKAAGSGEPDAMKKAGQSFIKRVIAVIILFLLPMIIDLILHLINLYGSTDDCFDVLK